MYTYSQLLLRNLTIGVVFSTIIAITLLFFSSSHLKQQQLEQQQLITKIFSNTDKKESAVIAQQMMLSLTFHSITVNTLDGEKLFGATKNINLIAGFITPLPTKISLEPQSISISYQINALSQFNFITKILLIVILVTLCIVFVAGKLSLQRYRKIIDGISQQIRDDFASVLSSNDGTKSNIKKKQTINKEATVFDLPELKSGLAEIQTQISGHMSSTADLEKQAFIEPLTQLENRNRFVEFFESQKGVVKFGVLTITRCSELQTINQIHGYNEGDTYICRVAEIMKNVSNQFQSSQLFRLNSSDFATILPNTPLKEAEKYAQQIKNQFNEYQQASDLDSVGYTGLVYFNDNRPLGELLALADTAISVAQTQQINAWFAQTDATILENSSASYGNQNWRQEIESVLENQRVTLLIQQLKPNNIGSRVYSEVLARFLNANDEMLPTASFIAMAEKLDKIVAVDRMIIEKVMSEITQKNLFDHHYGINISARTIHDEHFLIWLERRLLKDPAIAANLIFEITEYGLQQNIKTSKRFIDMIHRVGARITVERFGVGLTSFKFFRDLKPDFIKMDSTYTRDIDEDKNNQYFLRLMVDLAHRLSIVVLAESVESQEEKFTLEKLFIDGCQGFYIGKPEPM